MNQGSIDFPALVLTATVWAYWIAVGAMVLRARRRTRDLAGLVPQQALERRMWLVWVPLVGAWMTLPWLAQTRARAPWAIPPSVWDLPSYGLLRWFAAVVAVACLVLTAKCWMRMGTDWRMAVSEDQKSPLITDGLFARVRHPIYALSILLMLMTAIIVPTPLMIAIAAVHICLMVLKARNEERHLLKMHGDDYARYLRQTGRFVPRLSVKAA